MAVNKIKDFTLDEILKSVSTKRTKEEKIQVLRENNSLGLRDVLKGAFDDSIIFIIPPGSPPYTPWEKQNPPARLRKASRQFRYFVSGGPGSNMQKSKVEIMFIRLLESLVKEEAEVVIAMKDKLLQERYNKSLTKKLVAEAFPGLISK
tara:strand:+ start:17710 stop:18156 length:447 start_codon:yes stop_codon:yes gene_type:complete